MKTLIAFGTRYGATSSTAEEISRVLKDEGFDTRVVDLKGEKIKDATYLVVGDIEIYLTGIIDKEKEKKNLEKEISEIKKYSSQIKNKLDNKKFTANAPAEIVKKERKKYQESEKKLRKLGEKLKSLL